jgi:hypothetical protein
MNDIELTKKIASLSWEVSIADKTVKSDLVHYKIIYGRKFTDLKSVWISPDIPPMPGVINAIQRSAIAAYQEAVKNA